MERKWIFAGIAACMLFCSADVFAGGAKGSCSGGGSKSCCANVSHPNTGYFSRDRGDMNSNRYTSLRNSETFYCLFPKPRYGVEVSKHHATRNAFVIQHFTGDFYFREGVFFFHDKGKYVIHEPYVGFRVPGLPAERREYAINGTTYYYYYGTFYTLNVEKNYYEVVAPPVNAVVDWIPSTAEKLEVEGDTYYISDGVQYLSFSSGATSLYKVVMVDESLYSKGQGVTYYGFVNE